MIYGYARVSTDEQSDSIAAQVAALERFIAQSGFDAGGVFADENVSGSGIWFRNRPQGKLVYDALAPGDILVVTVQDRLTRNLADWATMMEARRNIGWQLYILQAGRYIQSPEDEMVYGMLACVGAYEPRRTSARVKAVCEHRRKSGLPYGHSRPVGWQAKDGEYVPLPAERAIADEVVRLREAGVTFPGIALHLSKKGYKKPGRREKTAGWYQIADVRSLYLAAVAGYPKIPRSAWKVSATAEKLCEAVSGGPRPASAASIPA
jgi:DNA invertase Pin-like site-specific DNA recombinase